MATNTQISISQSERAMSILAWALVAGCIVIPLYAVQVSDLGQFYSIVGVALVVGFSALLAGVLLGFLFGIPRTLQQGEKVTEQKNSSANESQNSNQQETRYAVNTNLEQISDWLTKILVGVGLTQISSISSSLREYSDFVGAELGGFSNSRVFSIAILLFFLIDGFLISYLWTRLHLAQALRQADDTSRITAIETKLDSIDIDAKVWSFFKRLVTPSPGSTNPTQEEINAVIMSASVDMKKQIFWEAQRIRGENRHHIADKPKMEHTIPVFRALIACDTDGVYEGNHGQLGYALVDQRKPDWDGAQKEFNEAIRLRGDWRTCGWPPYYELFRAICKINLDAAYQKEAVSDIQIKKTILADLEIANSTGETKELLQNDPSIQKWMELNGVKSIKHISRNG